MIVIENNIAIEAAGGHDPLSRYADPVTSELAGLAATFEDVQEMRKRQRNRLQQMIYGPTAVTNEQRKALEKHPRLASFNKLEEEQTKLLRATLQQHVLYPWLEQYRGLAGPRTARIIAAIGDPWRFPGQQCDGCIDEEDARVVHTYRPVLEVGLSCPITVDAVENEDHDGDKTGQTTSGDADTNGNNVGRGLSIVRIGVIQPPRQSTGVRSVWHYFGLMPDEETGRLVKLRKGRQASYNPKARVLILGDDGPADQIIKQRTAKYRKKYDEWKLMHDVTDEYPKWRVNDIAKLVAVKAFIGDLLTAWKHVAPLPKDVVRS